MYLVMKKKVSPIYISDQKFEDLMDLLLLIGSDKSHYVYIKGFNRFMFPKIKNKNKKWFCKSFLQYFSIIDFECNFKKVKCDEGSYTEKYQDHIPCSFAYKIVCIDRGKNAADEFIKAILEEYEY